MPILVPFWYGLEIQAVNTKICYPDMAQILKEPDKIVPFTCPTLRDLSL